MAETTTASVFRASGDFGVYDDAKTYYTDARHDSHQRGGRTRTYSQVSIGSALLQVRQIS